VAASQPRIMTSKAQCASGGHERRPRPPGIRSGRCFKSAARATHAFSRLELVLALVVVFVLAGAVLVWLDHAKEAARRSACASNLGQIGNALNVWANDRSPSGPPWRIMPAEGGLCHSPAGTNAWAHFAVLSNELKDPRFLVCPSDKETRIAVTFTSSAEGGLVHPNYQKNALSYFIGLDAVSFGPGAGDYRGWDIESKQVISGDRNIRVDRINAPCSALTHPVAAEIWPDDPATACAWTNGLHGPTTGNLLDLEGSVVQADQSTLLQRLRITTTDGRPIRTNAPNFVERLDLPPVYLNAVHLLMPR
jgi:hypothetical protein